MRLIAITLFLSSFFYTAKALTPADTVNFFPKHSISIGTDLLLNFTGCLGHRSILRYEYKGILYVQMGGGHIHFGQDKVYNNVRGYTSKGSFIMPGAGLIIPLVKSREVSFVFGTNYIRSFYSERGNIEILNQFWGTKVKRPLRLDNSVLDALQIQVGGQLTFKYFRVIPALHYNSFLGSLSPSQSPFYTSSGGGNKYQSYFVPGLGRVNEGNFLNQYGASFTIIYNFPPSGKKR
ncbi:MAG: hypothetical protein WC150_07825 [Bacteroidia bacterium]